MFIIQIFIALHLPVRRLAFFQLPGGTVLFLIVGD